MNRHIIITGYLLLLLFAKVVTVFAQQKTFRIYTADDGLISNSITTVFQDKDGFMWFGSNEGLSIYDANHFVNFTVENKGLSQNSIGFFFEKSKDEIWIPHNSGIDVFLNRRFVKTLPVKGIYSIIRSKNGRLIATGDRGIYEIKEDKKYQLFSSDKYYTDINEIGDHFLADESSWESITLFDSSFNILDSYTANKKTGGGIICTDNHEQFWFYTFPEVYLIDKAAAQKGSFNLLPGPPQFRSFYPNGVKYPFTDADGNCWFSWSGKGVVQIDREGHIRKYNMSNGLHSNNTSFFFEDAEGNIWVAGNNGLIKFFNKDFDVVSVPNGLASQFVSSIATSSSHHSVWMAQLNGISCLYQNKVYNFPYSRNQKCTWTTVLLQGDSLWVGFNALWLYKIHYDPQPRLELIREWTMPHSVSDLQLYKDGILISSIDELFYTKSGGDLLKLADSRFFFRFLVDGNELWGGARDGEGMTRWKIVSEKKKPGLQLMQQFYSTKGNFVHGIAKDMKGNIWFGGFNSGMLVLEKQKGDSFLVRHFQIQNGLSSNKVEDVFAGRQGEIYVGTNRGLSRLHRTGDSLCFEDLSRKYGFITDIYSITGNEAGDLWLATPSGAIRIKNDIKRNTLSPRIFITHVLNNNETDSLFDLRSAPLLLSHDKNNFNFEFSSTSFRNEEQVMYSYRLMKDKDSSVWSLPKKIHNVSIAGLSPGKYTFLVKAFSVDNVWSETPAKYRFTILQPYWETWWFRGLAVLLLFGLIAGIFWFRIRQLKKVTALRTQISRDLHDEIGSTLSGVSLFSEVAKQQLAHHQNKDADQSLDRIIANSDEMLEKMSDIVWAINPQNDSFEKLITRLRLFAAGAASQKGISLHFEVQKELRQYNPDMQLRKNIYLICKEAVNNAFKYAECRNLYVDFKQRDQQVIINIRDDGKGFDARQNFGGNGLHNMHARAQEMKANLSVISNKGEGTEIILILKIV